MLHGGREHLVVQNIWSSIVRLHKKHSDMRWEIHSLGAAPVSVESCSSPFESDTGGFALVTRCAV